MGSKEYSISEKVKEYLERKLVESKTKIKKLKRKKKINKVLLVFTVGSSIVISAVVASVSLTVLPPIAVTILSISSAVLTGISTRFNFQDKEITITREIEKLNKIQTKLDYVISCNGDLTQEEYQQILKDFNL
jgi:predicted amino acid racemase